MKLSQVLAFLPLALAVPSLHSPGHVDISISFDGEGNNDLMKAVTTPSNICLQVMLPPGTQCPKGWELVPLGDSGFYTCCFSKTDDGDDNDLKLVLQPQAGTQRLGALPPCTKQCSECADVCDIVTHECYNTCIDSQVSRAAHKGL